MQSLIFAAFFVSPSMADPPVHHPLPNGGRGTLRADVSFPAQPVDCEWPSDESELAVMALESQIRGFGVDVEASDICEIFNENLHSNMHCTLPTLVYPTPGISNPMFDPLSGLSSGVLKPASSISLVDVQLSMSMTGTLYQMGYTTQACWAGYLQPLECQHFMSATYQAIELYDAPVLLRVDDGSGEQYVLVDEVSFMPTPSGMRYVPTSSWTIGEGPAADWWQTDSFCKAGIFDP